MTDNLDIDRQMVERALRLHEDLRAWLAEHCPTEEVVIVATALSYEIGRLIASTGPDVPKRKVMLDQLTDVVESHVLAYQRGLRH